MATGRKNYFRHNVNARKDRKIVELIVGHGKAPYFHFLVPVQKNYFNLNFTTIRLGVK